MTLLVSLLAISVTAASSIDACGVLQYSEYFHVSDVVGSLATGKSIRDAATTWACWNDL